MEQQAQLVRRSQAGDRSAFERLFEAHRDRVFGLLWRQLDDRETAEELTVETFVRAWERLPGLAAPEAFPLWLRQIAVNLARDALRRRSRQPVASDLPDVAENQPDPARAGDRIMQDELTHEINRALAGLPDHYREVAVLHYLDDQPVKSIADVLSIPVGTVLSRLARARDQLRRKLSAYVEGA